MFAAFLAADDLDPDFALGAASTFGVFSADTSFAEEIGYDEQGPSEDNTVEENNEALTGIEEFAATTIDLSAIFPNEKRKAILIEDGDSFLTVGDNLLLAITKIDEMRVDDVTVISKKLLDNKDEIIVQLAQQLASSDEVEEITEEVTVNGVPAAEEK